MTTGELAPGEADRLMSALRECAELTDVRRELRERLAELEARLHGD